MSDKDQPQAPAAPPAAEDDGYEYVSNGGGLSRGWILFDIGITAMLAGGVGLACWFFSQRAAVLGEQIDFLSKLLAQRGIIPGGQSHIFVPPQHPENAPEPGTVPRYVDPETANAAAAAFAAEQLARAQRHASAPVPPDPAAVAEAAQHLAARVGLVQPAEQPPFNGLADGSGSAAPESESAAAGDE